MNPVRRYLNARHRARDVVAATPRVLAEALLAGDFTHIDPALAEGTLLAIIDEDAHHVYAKAAGVDDTIYVCGCHVVRLDTVSAT